MKTKFNNHLFFLFALLCLVVFFQSNAQEYNFIRYERNQIAQFKLGKNGALQYFLKGLKELENDVNRKVNIVHIGDSHVQADVLSGKIRELFQKDERFDNGGRGFIFPYPVAQTNNPVNYQVTYTGYWQGLKSVSRNIYTKWGLSAISSQTFDVRSTITVNPNVGNTNYTISRIKIFYPVFDQNSFNVSLDIDPKELLSTYLSRSGFVEYQFKNPQSEVKIIFNKNSSLQNHFLLQGISLENDSAGVLYHAIGINGATVPTYFRCEDFEKHLTVLQPDLVIVSLGANDTHVYRFNTEEYKNNLQYLVYEIRKAAPQASILLTTPADSYLWRRKPNPNNEKARQEILALAEEMNLAVWDFYEIMGGFRSIDKWVQHSLAAKDKLHFASKGYTLQGELLFDALNRAYKEYENAK
ncbi:MAG: GDSL-type esterase/lipase family protein [Thermoflexibacter sp.]|jgi:lysophospholipase L1-like esterase|nr:GDSL-type esterase/lipase family protein [Thermoflexibacter sp.]